MVSKILRIGSESLDRNFLSRLLIISSWFSSTLSIWVEFILTLLSLGSNVLIIGVYYDIPIHVFFVDECTDVHLPIIA
jgi:hypothetical protein